MTKRKSFVVTAICIHRLVAWTHSRTTTNTSHTDTTLDFDDNQVTVRNCSDPSTHSCWRSVFGYLAELASPAGTTLLLRHAQMSHLLSGERLRAWDHCPVGVAFKEEEDTVRVKRGRRALAGWKLKDSAELKQFRREEGVRNGAGLVEGRSVNALISSQRESRGDAELFWHPSFESWTHQHW